MASTPEMLRLMRHAAALLEAQRDRALRGTEDSRAVAAASAYGAAMLRMVAACIDDGPDDAGCTCPDHGRDHQ